MISRWLKRKAMERAEDYMRQSMGMPPRDKKKKRNSQSGNTNSQGGYYYQRERRNTYGRDRYGNEPLIPKEYAEDVEFTETKDYSSSESENKGGEKLETYHESQVSDAEWTEVKKPRSK